MPKNSMCQRTLKNHGKNSSKFYEIKKKEFKKISKLCFCYRFSDIARWHFIGRLKIEENPKILGFGKKSPSR